MSGYSVLNYRTAHSEAEFTAAHQLRYDTFRWLMGQSRAAMRHYLHEGRITQTQYETAQHIDDELMIAKRGYTSEGWSCAAVDRQDRIAL